METSPFLLCVPIRILGRSHGEFRVNFALLAGMAPMCELFTKRARLHSTRLMAVVLTVSTRTNSSYFPSTKGMIK